jgi:hypothetical protein
MIQRKILFMENVVTRPVFEGNAKNGAKAETSRIPTKEASGFMVKLNEKASEDVTLKKGTLWLLGAAVVILNLLFSYGGSFISWVRADTTRVNQLESVQKDVGELRKDVDGFSTKLDEIQRAMQAEREQRLKIEGFKAGVAEAQSDKGNK